MVVNFFREPDEQNTYTRSHLVSPDALIAQLREQCGPDARPSYGNVPVWVHLWPACTEFSRIEVGLLLTEQGEPAIWQAEGASALHLRIIRELMLEIWAQRADAGFERRGTGAAEGWLTRMRQLAANEAHDPSGSDNAPA